MQKLVKTFVARSEKSIDKQLNDFFATQDRTMISLQPIAVPYGTENGLVYVYVVTYTELQKKDVFKHAIRSLFS